MIPGRFPNGLELRGGAEVRASVGRTLHGHAALFNVEARIAGRFAEVLLPGCFKGSLGGRDILALSDHDPAKVLGRTRGGSLRLAEDGRGLAFEADLPATRAADDVLELVRAGLAGGCSFGFSVAQDGERWIGNRRELRAVTLHEISIVSAWPAYDGTSVNARARAPGGADAAARRRFLATVG